jgi:hypothetical protein
LAVAARTSQLKAMFLELSRNWEKLAIQLEDVFAKLAESEGNMSEAGEVLDKAKPLSGWAIWKQ